MVVVAEALEVADLVRADGGDKVDMEVTAVVATVKDMAVDMTVTDMIITAVVGTAATEAMTTVDMVKVHVGTNRIFV